MLFVDRLAGDPQAFSDLLPRPAQGTRVVDVELLQLLDQISQSCNGSEAYRRIAAVNCLVQVIQLLHGVSLS